MGGYTYLAHHGIKGQKWGLRRYQNLDGTLTPEGIQRHRRKFKLANAGIEKSAKIVESMKNSARNKGLIDDSDNLTESGKSFMDRLVQSSYYATAPLQKTAMAMAQPMLSKWPSDVKNEYLDAHNRSLECAKQGRASESAVWAARANAIATRQQLQSFYGVNVDSVLDTKYESLR